APRLHVSCYISTTCTMSVTCDALLSCRRLQCGLKRFIEESAVESQPNVLFVMTDQQRFDTIAALGNSSIRTPNMDRLVRRGVNFTNGYSTCPVCMPARYTIRSGSEPTRTGLFSN